MTFCHARPALCKGKEWASFGIALTNIYTLGKKVVTPRNEVSLLAIIHVISACEAKGKLVGRIHGFSMYCVHCFV